MLVLLLWLLLLNCCSCVSCLRGAMTDQSLEPCVQGVVSRVKSGVSHSRLLLVVLLLLDVRAFLRVPKCLGGGRVQLPVAADTICPFRLKLLGGAAILPKLPGQLHHRRWSKTCNSYLCVVLVVCSDQRPTADPLTSVRVFRRLVPLGACPAPAAHLYPWRILCVRVRACTCVYVRAAAATRSGMQLVRRWRGDPCADGRQAGLVEHWQWVGWAAAACTCLPAALRAAWSRQR